MHSEADAAPSAVVVPPFPQLAQDETSTNHPTSQMHSEADVAPGAAVVPLPQLAHDEPSRKYPTSQMHSVADVAPGAAVVPPLPQLEHGDFEVLSLYVLTGQVMQLGVNAPTSNPQPLPIPQAVVQVTMQALNPVPTPSECQDITSPAATVSPVGAELPL